MPQQILSESQHFCSPPTPRSFEIEVVCRSNTVCESVIDVSPPIVCGILGLLLSDSDADAAPEICEGLALLQHRGQDACGIITCGHKGRLYQCKANGMVRDVFDEGAVGKLV